VVCFPSFAASSMSVVLFWGVSHPVFSGSGLGSGLVSYWCRVRIRPFLASRCHVLHLSFSVVPSVIPVNSCWPCVRTKFASPS
jgi:hypothetical protein